MLHYHLGDNQLSLQQPLHIVETRYRQDQKMELPLLQTHY